MSPAQALKRLAKAWPTDPARPTLQFNELLRHIAEVTPRDKISPQTLGAVKALTGDYLKSKYPVTSRTTKPTSFPEHYNRLTLGYENALQGKQRTWFQVLFGIYK